MSLLKKILLVAFILSAIPFVSLWTNDNSDTDWVIYWMYDNWLTDYSNKAQFRPDKNIRRDEAAKFITNFAQTILGEQWEENSICYMFNDVPNKNKLRDYVIQSCELWYMKWKNNKFNPDGLLSNAQAIAIVIRMYEWILDEPKSDRSKNYYKSADELGLIDWLNLLDRKKEISRWNFATLLYRFADIVGNEYNPGQDDWDYTDDYSWSDEMVISYYSWITADFLSSANTCSPSSNITNVEFSVLWIDAQMKIYREIKWREGDKCLLYERMDDFSMSLNYDIFAQAFWTGIYSLTWSNEFDSILTGAQALIWKYITCRYSTWELVDMFQSELSGDLGEASFDMDKQGQDDCTWTLLDSWF
jgi:hypothetical protein